MKNSIDDLKKIVENLDYKTQLNKEELIEFLYINLEDEEGELIDDNNIVVMFYPIEDEDDSTIFVQFYFEYEFNINKLAIQALYKKVSAINRKLSFGHFNISEDENKIFFKYILSHDITKDFNSDLISDIVNICMYSILEYGDEFII